MVKLFFRLLVLPILLPSSDLIFFLFQKSLLSLAVLVCLDDGELQLSYLLVFYHCVLVLRLHFLNVLHQILLFVLDVEVIGMKVLVLVFREHTVHRLVDVLEFFVNLSFHREDHSPLF